MAEAAQDVKHMLRRYEIKPDGWDQFIELWGKIRAVREQYGFKVMFGLADRERNEFVWCVRYEGDYEAVAARYYAAPEREHLRVIGQYIVKTTVTHVDPVLI